MRWRTSAFMFKAWHRFHKSGLWKGRSNTWICCTQNQSHCSPDSGTSSEIHDKRGTCSPLLGVWGICLYFSLSVALHLSPHFLRFHQKSYVSCAHAHRAGGSAFSLLPAQVQLITGYIKGAGCCCLGVKPSRKPQVLHTIARVPLCAFFSDKTPSFFSVLPPKFPLLQLLLQPQKALVSHPCLTNFKLQVPLLSMSGSHSQIPQSHYLLELSKTPADIPDF